MYIFIANKFIVIYAGFMRLCGICEICGKSHNRIKPASLFCPPGVDGGAFQTYNEYISYHLL